MKKLMKTVDSYKASESAQINLIQAAHSGDIARARLALKLGALINHVDGSSLRLTPLLAAIVRCKRDKEKRIIGSSKSVLKMVEFLINKGANNKAKTNAGKSYKNCLIDAGCVIIDKGAEDKG